MDRRSKTCHAINQLGIYIFVIVLFCFLVQDSWTKYQKKVSATISSYIGNGNEIWTLPCLTFCPTSAFKDEQHIVTQEDFDRSKYSLNEIFDETEMLFENFHVNETDTLANGRCFSLTDKRERHSRDFTIIYFKMTIDLLLFVHDSLDDLVNFY